MEQESPLFILWRRILSELSYHQDEAIISSPGHVLNPVIKTVYVRETAFAAKVFAAEHKRSRDPGWLKRAERCLEALQAVDLDAGLEEPVWKPRGFIFKKGSIPATVSLLDSFWSTLDLLGRRAEAQDHKGVISFLKKCYLKNGFFAHDEVPLGKGRSVAAIQNTAAMALFLMEVLHQKGIQDDFIARERMPSLRALLQGQRSDGFWPYVFPGLWQRCFFAIPFLRPGLNTKAFKLLSRGDRSILFGDTVHHCYILYFLLKRKLLCKTNDSDGHLIAGWNWLKGHMIRDGDGLAVDFSWEPVPHGPRYCNFRDTTTYFLVISIALMFKKLSMIKEEESHGLIDGLLKHIEKDLLLGQQEHFPCIKPYEGPWEIIQNIFPRAAESVAWKGALLADLVLESVG